MLLQSRVLPFLTAAIVLHASGTVHAQAAPAAPLVELRGGSWFDGTRFVDGSRYMRAGRFVERGRTRADSVVDLTGRWMVPPFADAHTHSPDGAWGFENVRDMYLRLGVFYVQTLANSRAGRIATAARLNIPSSVDVAHADGAVTGTGGHPQVLYESLGLYQRFWQVDSERYAAARSLKRDGDVYHRLDSLPQLAPLIARLARDTVPVLKVMLLDSERWATRHTDSTQFGFIGMNPALLPALVDAAHRMGRRVWAHIETPYDLEIGLRAGVDAFAHVPGYGAVTTSDSVAATYRIPDSTVRLAGKRRVFMTPILVLAELSAADDTAKRRRFESVMVANTRALQRAGVRLVSGSDTYSNADVVRGEPVTMARWLGLSPLQQLRLWSVETPMAVFPSRRIAQLRPGFEASALALRCDPLRDVTCVGQIDRRLKQGVWMPEPRTAP